MGNFLAKRQRKQVDKKRRASSDQCVRGGNKAELDAGILDNEEYRTSKYVVVTSEEEGMNDNDGGQEDEIDISQYEYPFENIVFEGGGCKGLAYCGAIEVLEQLGIRDNIKRVAGTSAGAITASLFAVGYSSAEIRQFLDEDMSSIFVDHSCGYLSVVPNLIRHFGWNPANRLLEWLSDKLEKRSGNGDITFRQLLKKFNVELCVVATNLNRRSSEYFHPKTTPNVPVKEAVRMSMSMPVFFQAFCRDVHDCGQKDTFVDGGLLCNYPISCFDGWWLSMRPEDSFLRKLNKLEELPRMFEQKTRFGDYNDKTFGFLLYANNEKDLLRATLERSRKGTGPPTPPDTKLGRKYKEKLEAKAREMKEVEGDRGNLDAAMQAFLDALVLHDKDNDSNIDLQELRHAMEHEGFQKYKAVLFDKNATAESVMSQINVDGSDDGIQFGELDQYFGRRGYSLTARLIGDKRKNVTHFFSFLKSVEKTLHHNVQRLVVQEADANRTVGINTGYIGTKDFVLEDEDKEYLVQQGRKSTEVFLKEYIKEQKKTQSGSACPSPVPNTVDLYKDAHETITANDTSTDEHIRHEAMVCIETPNDSVMIDRTAGDGQYDSGTISMQSQYSENETSTEMNDTDTSVSSANIVTQSTMRTDRDELTESAAIIDTVDLLLTYYQGINKANCSSTSLVNQDTFTPGYDDKQASKENKHTTVIEVATGATHVVTSTTEECLAPPREDQTKGSKDTPSVAPKEDQTQGSKDTTAVAPKENKTQGSKDTTAFAPKEDQTQGSKDTTAVSPKDNQTQGSKDTTAVAPKEDQTQGSKDTPADSSDHDASLPVTPTYYGEPSFYNDSCVEHDVPSEHVKLQRHVSAIVENDRSANMHEQITEM